MGSGAGMTRYSYRHSGCLVHSELELPEWHAFAVKDGAEPDVTIRLAEELGAAAPPNHTPVMDDDALRFSVPDVGTWRISGGNEIAIQSYGDPSSIEVRLFTLGSAWGTLGYQRGWAMLHGSAVLGRQGAVLFCGPQGAGKSTLARLITMIEKPNSGALSIEGTDAVDTPKSDKGNLRRTVQLVFQNPYGSLNPRKKIGTILE